ncbi:MAG: HAMP domain-containing protein [Zoogloeaceae bacterium]|nr:HAMP domain-containing protein [Zoogloeaceae bacterium]
MRKLFLPLIGILGILLALLLFLLVTASANTDLFANHYPLLIGINAVAAVTLLVPIAIQLRRLKREYRQRVFGSRLKSRLVVMLALMAVLPGMMLYGVSMLFAVKSIDSWFDVRVDKALEGGLNLGRNVLDAMKANLLETGRDMAAQLAETQEPAPRLLNRLREQAGIQSAALFDLNGSAVASSSEDMSSLLPSVPSLTHLRQARFSRGTSAIEGDAESGLTVRILIPVAGFDLGVTPQILQLIQPVPSAVAASTEAVNAAYQDYQSLQLARDGLKRIYTLTLTFTLLVALFAAVALAFFLAERLVRPLLILAEGTQAVAAGDFTPRVAWKSHDELGVLTRSFSDMTRQLDEARSEASRQQAYLESVLANLSAGVLAFDAEFRLQGVNRSAGAILKDDLAALGKTPLPEWQHHQTLAATVMAAFREQGPEWQQQFEFEGAAGVPQTLLLRGSMLPGTGGGGYVVVFDDISQLISAQRSIAWGEVARRLAHEIKNPLTPIRLSAERLQIKLAEQLAGDDREMLNRSIATIVNQVDALKHMINNFRDYAKTPPPVLAPLDVNALIRELMHLYEADAALLETSLTPELPLALADGSQIRQVLHNLIKNAREALVEHPPVAGAPKIIVATRREERRVAVTVSDNGPGFGVQILARACEPYVSSKTKGTGLGLAIVRKIVEDHKGELRLLNRTGGGAEVTLKLPLAA